MNYEGIVILTTFEISCELKSLNIWCQTLYEHLGLARLIQKICVILCGSHILNRAASSVCISNSDVSGLMWDTKIGLTSRFSSRNKAMYQNGL